MFLKNLTQKEFEKILEQATPLEDHPTWGIVTLLVCQGISHTHRRITKRPHLHYMVINELKHPIAFHCSNSEVALCLSLAGDLQKRIAINSIRNQVNKLTIE